MQIVCHRRKSSDHHIFIIYCFHDSCYICSNMIAKGLKDAERYTCIREIIDSIAKQIMVRQQNSL